MTDELLQPTVTSNPPPARKKPWRVWSQMWVAFFGGILAVTVIALLNAERLGIDTRKRWLMALAGLVAFAVLLVLWLRLPTSADYLSHLQHGRALRIHARVIAVVLFLLLAAMQKKAEQQHLVFATAGHASLWIPGITASLTLGILQLLLVAGISYLAGQ